MNPTVFGLNDKPFVYGCLLLAAVLGVTALAFGLATGIAIEMRLTRTAVALAIIAGLVRLGAVCALIMGLLAYPYYP